MKKLLIAVSLLAASFSVQAEWYMGAGLSETAINTEKAREKVSEHLNTNKLPGEDIHIGIRPESGGWGFRMGATKYSKSNMYDIDRARDRYNLPNSYGGTVNINIEDDDFGAAGELPMNVSEFIETEFFRGYLSSDNGNQTYRLDYDVSFEPIYQNSTLKVSLDLNAYYVDAIYYWSRNDEWGLYAGGGAVHYQAKATATLRYEGYNLSDSISDKITIVRLLGGIDYRLSPSLSVAAEMVVITDKDYSVTAGIRYYF